LSDKKGAGGWIGGSSFDAVSGNATTKLIYLALRNITKKWKKPPVDFGFAI
jgi:hypothetical protein